MFGKKALQCDFSILRTIGMKFGWVLLFPSCGEENDKETFKDHSIVIWFIRTASFYLFNKYLLSHNYIPDIIPDIGTPSEPNIQCTLS